MWLSDLSTGITTHRIHTNHFFFGSAAFLDSCMLGWSYIKKGSDMLELAAFNLDLNNFCFNVRWGNSYYELWAGKKSQSYCLW